MALPTFVCPPEREVLRALAGRTVAVRTDEAGAISSIPAAVTASGCDLAFVLYEPTVPLAEVALDEAWEGMRLVLAPPAFGAFRTLAPRLDLLRRLDVRVHLPGGDSDALVGLRILSSLGVAGCAVLDGATPDWDALADLATFAVLERLPHAPIDPFSWIVEQYEPGVDLWWGGAQFGDPRQFLHVDDEGRIAMSAAERTSGAFIADGPRALEAPSAAMALQNRIFQWQDRFLQGHPCTRCEGWRLCHGTFATDGAGLSTSPCAAFFGEMIEIAEQARSLRDHRGGRRPWRP